jgi:hypothetical protein
MLRPVNLQVHRGTGGPSGEKAAAVVVPGVNTSPKVEPPVTSPQAKLEGARTVLHHTGVAPFPAIRENARIMAGTGLVYLVIQGPAMKFARDGSEEPPRDHHISSEEHW